MKTFFDWLHTPPEHLDENAKEMFLVGNYASILGFLVHLLFLVYFIFTDIKSLAYFNIASILIFSLSFTATRVGKLLSFNLSVCTLEILLHAAVTSFVLGTQSGFHLYLLGASMMWMLHDIPIAKKLIVAMASSIFSIGVLAMAPKVIPIETIPSSNMNLLYLANAFTFTMFVVAIALSYNVSVNRAKKRLQKEYKRSEFLLHNVLPPPIAKRLKDINEDGAQDSIADGYPACSVLFADIVGFTVISQQLAPTKLVSMLNEIFSRFDNLVEAHGLEKIKTIGDAYMVASGIPEADGNHAKRLADFSLDMVECMNAYSQNAGLPVHIRVGIHSGPAVAGVIGKNKFIYDIWGDTVNTASRMESHGVEGEIHISNLTKELLGNNYDFEDRQEISIKGKGMMRTWLLKGSNLRTSS